MPGGIHCQFDCADSKTPAVERFMPDRMVEEFVSISLQQFIGKVAGKRKHRQHQDSANGVSDDLDNGEPDRA
jgi:hypothetical protein